MSRWHWVMAQFSRRLWVRATLLGALGGLAAVVAALVERFIPWPLPTHIGADAVDSLLTIIASSMLAVTTFSLSIMVSAYGSATNNVTPRATKLLIEDRLTQTVLATFVGSFLFGIVGLIVLKTGAYGERGRFVLFVITIIVIALVVISLLRWIDHLTRLGRVGETTNQVERVTRRALEIRKQDPHMGGRPYAEPPSDAIPIPARTIGYVQHVDISALSRIADANTAEIYVSVLPGSFIYAETTLAWVRAPQSEMSEEDIRQINAAFSIGDERSFDYDPRFGLAVMSEIGSRALSPATNDPGTAIDVIGRITRLLSLWAEAPEDETQAEEPAYPRVFVPSLGVADLFEDGFMLMARDGAGLIEVQLRIQKSLAALSKMGNAAFRQAARTQSDMAFSRATVALTLDADKDKLREIIQHR